MYGKKEQIPELKSLWIEVFGDSELYVDAFFENIFQKENVIVYEEKKEVLAALYMVPYKVKRKSDFMIKETQMIAAEGGDHKAVYLYALATKKSARNRGIMSRLIRESQRISWERGYDYQFLIPSEDKIKAYYKRFGFEAFVCRTKGMLNAEELKDKSGLFMINQNEMEEDGNCQIVSAMRRKISNDKWENAFFIEKVLM